MKRIIFLLIGCILVTGCVKQDKLSTDNKEKELIKEKKSTEKNNYVSYNGNLKVSNTNIVNQYNDTFVLKGISSHGIQWFGYLITDDNIETLKEYGINVFRIAMYTEENGYINNKNLKDDLYKYVDMLTQKDLYVIIDWHILSDSNPNKHVGEAIAFFDEVSKKYKDNNNILYEICNEPNSGTTWSEIKKYADKVIPVIRKNTDSIIIVGTPNWDQYILDPLEDLINQENIMYALHFYAGSHKEDLRNKLIDAIKAGLPIFVSEWGVSDASGNGGIYLEESQKWINLMKEKNISWCNWSLSDKNESSAFLKEGTKDNIISDSSLSESGKYIKKVLGE